MAEKETNSTKNTTTKSTGKSTATPKASAKSSSTAKTTATEKPAATTKSKTAATPKASAKPSSTAKTAATEKPAATTKSKTAATPKASTKSSSTAKTTATEKPAVTTKSKTTTASPTATAATAAKSKTTAKAEPAKAKAKIAAAETKTEKAKKTVPVKTAKATKATKTNSAAQAMAVDRKKKLILSGIIGLSVILVVCLCIGLIFGIKSCTGMKGILKKKPVTVNAYSQTTLVGYSAETIGTVNRYKPVDGIHDERDLFPLGISVDEDARYPKYGYTMNSVIGDSSEKVLARNRLIQESSYLTATGTANAGGGGYTWMDENGYLYSGTRHEDASENTPAYYSDGTQRQLYKHTASVGLYLGDVSDDEPGIIKEVKLRPRGYSSYSVTGVYAAAGEVIKIEISDADMAATGGVTIHIGQALYNGQANNIWAEKGQMQRIPHLLNTMQVNKNTAYFNESTQMWTAYVGSFIGGPLYVRNTSSTVTVRISGGVAYRHFILGYTSPEEYEELCKSTAPYFDLEVWDRGVLHSGPVSYANSFSYDDLYKAAVLWEKVAIVANSNGAGNDYYQGIVFLYDPFVAAGAAVAFPGRSSVNCPMGWMSSSLNYNATVTSGSWGNFHEFHHNFQNFGVGYTGEVTNNALTLVDYSLFTNISSARQLSSYGGAGLSGWNCYTSATWALNQVNKGAINSTSGLAVYATLLHNFGQDAFINARGYTGVNYLNQWANVTHQDFSYFDSQITVYTGGKLNPAETEYPLFVPVSSVYQTGRSYNYDGELRYIETMQPYVIPYGQSFAIDLNPYSVNADGQYLGGSIVIGNGFYYKIKEVRADGINGTVVKSNEDGIYTFTPNTELLSGKIYVTIEIYNSADDSRVWNGHALQDVDLILEFKQSHEWNKAILERTTYVYNAGELPATAAEAYESGYAGNTGAVTVDNKNYSQNSNTDVWLYPDDDKYINDPTFSSYVMTANSVIEINGKLYFPEDGKYRIYLRGRQSCALYLSYDGGKTYSQAAYIDTSVNPSNTYTFFANDDRTYIDVDVNAEDWIYFKEVVIIKNLGGKSSFVGLGIGQWTVPLYTTTVKYYNAEGQEVSADSDDIVRTETFYFDGKGNPVDAETASDVTPIPPTSVSYATAYRCDYEFQKEFESDYFYLRNYNYNYIEAPKIVSQDKTITPTTDCNYRPWFDYQVLENLFDGDYETEIHFSNAWGVSATNPAILAFDLGETVTANSITLYTNRNANGNDKGFPRNFTLEGSLDGITYFPMGTWNGLGQPSVSIELTFNDKQTFEFRYFRLTITGTSNGRVSLAEIEFSNTFRLTGNGNNLFSPDNEMFTYKGNWKVESCSANFGHVFVGKKATMEFEFEGTRFAILASKYYGKNYKVYIDGKEVKSVDLMQNDGDFAVAYLTPELEDKKHSVVIYCKNEGNIDSIAIW